MLPWQPLGALLTALLVYRLALIDGHMAVETLILAGVVMSSFMSAILSYMLTRAGESLHQIIYWLMGSLGLRGSEYFIYTLPLLVAGVFLLCLYGRDLNILTFGEETAGQLGISVERTKRIILLLAALLTGIAVLLAVPSVLRINRSSPGTLLCWGPDHRVLLPSVHWAVFFNLG